ncbi:high-affinity Zn(2+) transporter zrt1 [Podila epigama]|nr:high-affinity Zn(2+) transporter zrt1 [Podila epigama]
MSSRVLTLGKQFGTGVILATGFIHMLPTAMANLSSPCLGPAFSENYTAFGGLFILLSSLFMHWIEFVAVEHNERRMREAATTKGVQQPNLGHSNLSATNDTVAPCPGHVVTMVEERPCHDSCSSVSSCNSEYTHEIRHEDPNSTIAQSTASSITQTSPRSCAESSRKTSQETRRDEPSHEHDHHVQDNRAHKKEPSTAHGLKHNHNRQDNRHDDGQDDGQDDACERDIVQAKSYHHHTQEAGHSHAHGLSILDESQRRISTYILEAGIAAHSVIIGISLGVSTGGEFMGLLLALVFHQFFEGFALGARIADLTFNTTYTHYLLALVFSSTTPTGVAIGICISNTYSPNSKSSLLVEGIFDSISTGILLYMGYVNLLAVEFNQNNGIRKESKTFKSLCFIALWAGAIAMTVIGRFA